MRRRSRARRVLGVLGAVVGTTVTFVVGTAAAAVVHLDVPATRRLVATQVTGILHGALKGDVTIEHIDHLGLRGVSGVRAHVADPDGVRVLTVSGVGVKLQTLALARSALFEKGDIRVPVDSVEIGDADVALDADPSGESLRLANAFEPKSPSPPKKDDKPGRGVRVEAPNVALGHAWAHGTPPGAPLVDAEIRDLRGRAHVEQSVITADVLSVGLVARALPPVERAALRGDVVGSVKLPSAADAGPIVSATFDGDVAGARTTAEAHLDGKRLDARVDVAGLTGEELKTAIGEIPLAQPATLHAEAHGELPRIGATAHAEVGAGTVDADAAIQLADGPKSPTTIRANAHARHVDLHAIAASAPRSDLGLDARGSLALATGELRGEASVQTLPGRIDRDAIPPAQIHAAIANDMMYGAARIADPRLPTEIAVAMFPGRSGKPIVEARLTSEAPDLRRVPRVGALVSGSARLRGDARVDLGTKAIAARVEIDGADLAQGAQTAGSVHASARAAGTLDRPIVDADVHAGDVKAGPVDARTVDAHARVTPLPELVVTDARVDVARPDVSVAVRAARIAVGGGRVAVEDATIAGLGEPLHLAMTKDSRELRVVADADAIDLRRVASFVGKKVDLKDGHVELHGDVALRKDDATGEVHVKLEDLKTSQIRGAGARLDARVVGRSVDVDLQAALGEVGTFAVKTENAAIGGGLLDPASWRAATGRVDLESNVDLARVTELVPMYQLPVSELGGKLVVVGHAGRPTPDVAPDVSLSAYTLGLVATGWADPDSPHAEANVRGPAPWRTLDLDVELDARAEAAGRQGEIAVRLVDREGIVAALDAKANVPFDEITRDPSGAVAKLERMPIRAKLVVPKRPLDKLPPVLALHNYAGTVDASLDVEGTALEPRVELAGHLRGVKGAALPVEKTADADVALTYDGSAANLRVGVATAGKEVLDLVSRVDVKTRDLLEPRRATGSSAPAALAWDGSAHVKLDAFPLQAVDPIASRRVKGTLTGEATLDGLHENAALHARFESKDLAIGRAKYKGVNVSVDAADGAFGAHARLEQTDGYADLRAKAAMTWGAALAPSVDRNKPVEAALDAKGFRAAAIAPFVQGTLNELDGRVDANAEVKLGPGPKDMRMNGRVELKGGTLQIAAIGEELHDARMTVTLSPDGVVNVTHVAAKGIEGELTGDARAQLRGLAFESAQANLHIPDKKPLDVTMQGQPIGRIHGDVHMKATATPDMSRIDLGVDVPTVAVELPQVMKGGLQDLGDPKDIRAGMFRTRKNFVVLPFDEEDLHANADGPKPATTLDVKVHVGEATILRGNQARIVLGGDPHIVVTDKARVSGQIQLKSGKLDVQGKKFEIEKGTVTFQPEDPSNPIVVVTAAWTAEDGTKVFADFVGPVKTGKVELRSEPPRPKNEIFALVLFGTADGANAAPPPPGRQPDGTTRAATAVGGGFAAQGLTEAMDDLTGVEATARIDTTHSDNPRPEVEFQIARDISVQFAHVLGTPPISEPDTNYATVDWRFRRNWSLETTFGDRGSAMVDAVWQKRY